MTLHLHGVKVRHEGQRSWARPRWNRETEQRGSTGRGPGTITGGSERGWREGSVLSVNRPRRRTDVPSKGDGFHGDNKSDDLRHVPLWEEPRNHDEARTVSSPPLRAKSRQAWSPVAPWRPSKFLRVDVKPMEVGSEPSDVQPQTQTDKRIKTRS